MRDADDFCKFLGIIFGGIIVAVIATVLNTVAIAWLWAWFLVPLGLMKIGYIHAMGIEMTARYILNQYSWADHEAEKEIHWGVKIAQVIFKPLIAMFFGWIVFKLSGL